MGLPLAATLRPRIAPEGTLMATTYPAAPLRAAGQCLLGLGLAFAGTGHLTFAREEFQAQVPAWVPIDADLVVVASGVVELALGAALLATWRQPARAVVGVLTAGFFVAVFPGNVAQYLDRVDAFGLESDTARAVRLGFQPVLVASALWSTAAVRELRSRRAGRRAGA